MATIAAGGRLLRLMVGDVNLFWPKGVLSLDWP